MPLNLSVTLGGHVQHPLVVVSKIGQGITGTGLKG
jgi:hypothetical protein